MKDGLHIDAAGNKRWHKNGRIHRESGPAVEITGEIFGFYQGWYINGVAHKEDGPARIWTKNYPPEWWLNGKFLGLGEKPNNWDELVKKARAEKLLEE